MYNQASAPLPAFPAVPVREDWLYVNSFKEPSRVARGMASDEAGGNERVGLDDVDTGVATAFGLFALSDASVYEAAEAAGVSRWKLEDEIDRAGLAGPFGLDEGPELSSTIDDLLEEYSE